MNTNCKNCNQLVDGNFCAHCGQSIKVDKIDLSYFLNEMSDSVFQINRGLFYTIKELFLRPGQCIKDYLNGKRKQHFKPIAYAFTLSTIYFLLSKFLESGTIMNDFIQGYANGAGVSDRPDNQIITLKWFAQNYAYTMLMLLPLFSLATYLTFLNAGFNYLEHFVLNAFITGQQALLYSLTVIFGLIVTNDDLLDSVTLCFSIAYALFVFWQFFSEQSRIAVVFRSVLVYVLYLILLILVIITIFFVFPR